MDEHHDDLLRVRPASIQPGNWQASCGPMIDASIADRFASALARSRSAIAPDLADDRGIVICAGGARLFTCAWVAIGLLRRHFGCVLPIQVWHLGPEELGPPMRDLLSRFDVEIVDALEVARFHPADRLAGWELKPFAIMNCRFREVLLLDADNAPVRDPTFLFDAPEYKLTGAIFWPDVVRIGRDNPVWSLTGLEPWRGPSLESGQIVIDKSRCWPAVSLTHWMNQNAADFYDIIWGDKDTFLVAWLALKAPFHLVPYAPDQLEGVLCQKDLDGEVLFQHRTNAKWTLAGRSRPVEGFRFQAESAALLAELAAEWDGWVYNPPARSDAARAAERTIVEQGTFELTRISFDQKSIQLLPSHRVGKGAAYDLVYWHVQDGAEGLELVLGQGGFVSARLKLETDGAWRGDWIQAPFTPAQLTPLAPAATDLSADGAPHLIALLDDLRTAFEARAPESGATTEFAETLASIARVRPTALEWINAVAIAPNGTRLCKEAAARALPLVGQRAQRFRGPTSVQSRSLEGNLGYERD